MSLSSVLFGFNQLPLADEDAIKELSFVLRADSADLADLGAAEGNISLVVALEDELVLDITTLSELDGNALKHLDGLVLLAAEEVLYGDLRAVLGDDHIDREVSVHQSHSEAVALS